MKAHLHQHTPPTPHNSGWSLELWRRLLLELALASRTARLVNEAHAAVAELATAYRELGHSTQAVTGAVQALPAQLRQLGVGALEPRPHFLQQLIERLRSLARGEGGRSDDAG